MLPDLTHANSATRQPVAAASRAAYATDVRDYADAVEHLLSASTPLATTAPGCRSAIAAMQGVRWLIPQTTAAPARSARRYHRFACGLLHAPVVERIPYPVQAGVGGSGEPRGPPGVGRGRVRSRRTVAVH